MPFCSHVAMFLSKVNNVIIIIYIYLYTWLISPLKGSSRDKAFRVLGGFILSSSVSIFLLERIQRRDFPDPLLCAFWLPFTNCKEYSGSILAVPTIIIIIMIHLSIYHAVTP